MLPEIYFLDIHSPPLNDTRNSQGVRLSWLEMKESVAVMALRKSEEKGGNCGKVKAEVCRKGMGVTGGGGGWTRWLPPQPHILAEEDSDGGWWGRGGGGTENVKACLCSSFKKKEKKVRKTNAYRRLATTGLMAA